MAEKRLMKECAAVLAMVIVMGAVLVSTYDESSAAAVNEYEGIIRLHVIANSNSPEDQQVKLQVRDAIIEELGDFNGASNIEESRRYLASHLDDMIEISRSVLAENGFDYGADGEISVCWIPEKTYGDLYFPSGNYEALRITLGEGEGENWWCVLFPPLCLIGENPGEEGLPEEGEQMDIQLKSKIMEILEGR